MSAAVRQLLADAASTVEGITGHAYYVQATDPGHCSVRLTKVAYPNALGGVAHWSVDVTLPQDLADAEHFAERVLPDLHEALDPHLVITEASLGRLSIPNVGDLPTLFITGHREDD